MKKEISIETRTFKDEKGREIAYTAYILTVSGKEFQLVPRKDDKKLLNYLIESELDRETDRIADEADDEDKPF